MTDPLPIEHPYLETLGPRVHERRLVTGRTVRFIDEGDPNWPAVLFLGGAGTSVRAFRLLEFARAFREELELRIVSVERNGLGLTPFRPGYQAGDYAADVWALLDDLDIRDVAVVAISGGGPFAAAIMVGEPARVRSIHLACAYSHRLDTAASPYNPARVMADPVAWWTFPATSAVHRIPGFVESAIEEATHSLLARGPVAGGDAVRAEHAITHQAALPDLTAVDAPAFLYWGRDDDVVPLDHLAAWQRALTQVRAVRAYPHEGHDVQYRHWDQILCDIRHQGGRIVVSLAGRTELVTPEAVPQLLRDGAVLGLAGWET